MFRPLLGPLWALWTALAVLAPAAASAGTVCGTVRDAETIAPVAHAGVFLRLPSGPYTGLHGATDETGHFCIADVPPGTYDIEVRVDDYTTAYVRGIEVTGPVSVDIPSTAPPLQFRTPYPNPTRTGVRFEWTTTGPADVTLVVLDAGGRIVRGWRGPGLVAGRHSLDWDLRGSSQHAIPAGLYFVRLSVGARSVTRTFVRAP